MFVLPNIGGWGVIGAHHTLPFRHFATSVIDVNWEAVFDITTLCCGVNRHHLPRFPNRFFC